MKRTAHRCPFFFDALESPSNMVLKNSIDYRDALSEMRKVTPNGDPIPFSLAWFEVGSPPKRLNEGKYREEHNLILCGQKDNMKGKYIDVSYKDSDYHATRIMIQNMYKFNDSLIRL